MLIALVLAIFGFGQGPVMAPLSSVVLSTVKPAAAGAGSGLYGTTAQIANAAGVAAIGAAYFAIDAQKSPQVAMFAALTAFAASIATCVALLSRMRRVSA
jgi:predicted MFS family arabinose efflux permease